MKNLLLHKRKLQRDLDALTKKLETLKKEQQDSVEWTMNEFADIFLDGVSGTGLADVLIKDFRKNGLIKNNKFKEDSREAVQLLIVESTADLMGKDKIPLFLELVDLLKPIATEGEVELLASTHVAAKLFKRMEASLQKKPDPIVNVQLWSDQELTNVGKALWERTYKVGGDDVDARRVAAEMAKNWGDAAEGNGVLVNEKRLGVVHSIAAFCAKWAVHAFQRITTSHTYAAALMCSDADKAVLEDIELQWHAFMVMLPVGLLTYEDDDNGGAESSYSRILIANYDDGAMMILLNQSALKTSHRIVGQVSSSLATLLDVNDVKFLHTAGEEGISTATQDKVQRTTIMAKRLVAGLLLALQHQNNFKMRQVPARTSLKGREHDEPAHRVVFVGKPLKIDCRPMIRDFINNGSPKRKGAPPAVQCVVRGHFKRQVVGIARSGRKVIWVSPYWRGPEDAPILTRPKHVGV